MIKTFAAFLLAILAAAPALSGADPTATAYTMEQCQGSAMPYPTRTAADIAVPDSLTPIFANHCGRHGARFLSSSKYTASLLRRLDAADSLGTITAKGRSLADLCRAVNRRTAGRWGALDSLGMAEQRAIASRMFQALRPLFSNTKVSAISSYVPRCVMSMYEFTHQLSRLDNKVEIYTSSGRQNSPLMRPWTGDKAYEEFIDSDGWHKVYDDFIDAMVPVGVAREALGAAYPMSDEEARDAAREIYKVVAGCQAMGLPMVMDRYFTAEQANSLWAVENLHHYLTHSASTLSDSAPDMATALLLELLQTLESAARGENPYAVMLRFGHAETMMPLLALMHLPGCYYMTNYFDTVGLHWRDFYVVPMASNLRLILLRSASGRLYLRTDLNETPVPLIPGRADIYVPWESARDYLTRCLPLHLQP